MAASSGKEAWVEAALVRYERPLLHYAARITHDADLARDVVQDTFLKLCEADQGKVDEHLAAWLYTVCRNRALNVRQKEARLMPMTEDALEARAPDAGTLAVRNETRRRVLTLIEGLPQDQQEAFQLKFRDGLNYREISGVMGVSLGTVSSLITAALNVLRGAMKSDMDLAQEVRQ